MFAMTRDEIRKSLADECKITLDHADIHLQSAISAEAHGDNAQIIHDADVASRILRYIVLDLEGKS